MVPCRLQRVLNGRAKSKAKVIRGVSRPKAEWRRRQSIEILDPLQNHFLLSSSLAKASGSAIKNLLQNEIRSRVRWYVST